MERNRRVRIAILQVLPAPSPLRDNPGRPFESMSLPPAQTLLTPPSQLSEAKARVRELEEFIAARDLARSSSPLGDEPPSHASSSPCPPLSLSSAPSHPQDSSVFDTALKIFQQHLEWSWPGVAHSPQRSSFYAIIYRQTGTILDMSGFWTRVSDSYQSQYPATQPQIASPKWPSYQLVQ